MQRHCLIMIRKLQQMVNFYSIFNLRKKFRFKFADKLIIGRNYEISKTSTISKDGLATSSMWYVQRSS